MSWYLRACQACQGDLHDDVEQPGWVVCFMCARSFRATEVRTDETRQVPKLAAAPLPPTKAA